MILAHADLGTWGWLFLAFMLGAVFGPILLAMLKKIGRKGK